MLPRLVPQRVRYLTFTLRISEQLLNINFIRFKISRNNATVSPVTILKDSSTVDSNTIIRLILNRFFTFQALIFFPRVNTLHQSI